MLPLPCRCVLHSNPTRLHRPTLFAAVLRLHGGVPSAPLPTPTFAARTAAAGMAQQGTHVRQQQQSGGMTWRLPPQ